MGPKMMKQIRQFVCVMILALSAVASGCVSFYPPLDVVEFVDPERYAGKWYEIARYPNSFERGCAGVTADYALREDGKIDVVNTCRQGEVDGPERSQSGVARIVDEETNAKLKVSFFFPFEGDYWIIELDKDYQWAVVGEPSRRFLWILSRTPQMDEQLLSDIFDTLPEKGYDSSQLERVPQPPA